MTAPRPPFRLTPEQYDLLTRALDTNRVGKNPRGYSHLEAWDVRRWLIRIFGFGGFDIANVVALVKEIESPPGSIKYANGGANNKTVWTVVYRAETRLTVWDQFGGHAVLEDGACGDSTNQPSPGDAHDNALKTALSQALKRCAVNLGDCFGLGLYNNGRTDAVVKRTLVAPELPGGDAPAAGLPADDGPVLPEPGTELPVDEHDQAAEPAAPEASAEPAPPAPPAPPQPPPAPTPTGVRDWALASDRTADGVRRAAAKLRQEHPAMAKTKVTNEHGDPEVLGALLDRRARELSPAAPPASADEERRRKRMHALWRDLGLGTPASRDARLADASRLTGRPITSTADLVWPGEVEAVITALETAQRSTQQGAAV